MVGRIFFIVFGILTTVAVTLSFVWNISAWWMQSRVAFISFVRPTAFERSFKVDPNGIEQERFKVHRQVIRYADPIEK